MKTLKIDNVEYNVSGFRHPGGQGILDALDSKDASDLFHAFHIKSGSSVKALRILKRLPTIGICPKTAADLDEAVQDFRKLRERFDSEEGWYQTPARTLLLRLAWPLCLWTLAVSLTLNVTGISSCVAAALATSFFFHQAAFVGHCAGHSSVTHSRRLDSAVGMLVGNLATGISIGWWRSTHNMHHVFTNSVPDDPDIQHEILAIADDFWDRDVFSTYHKRVMARNRLTHWFVSNQHVLFYPVMLLARFNLYVQSILWLANQRNLHATAEAVLLAGHFVGIAALLLRMDSALLRATWLLVANAGAGILHVQIALSHFSMPVCRDDSAYKSFFHRQLATSMDIHSSPATDFLHGGLQYQTTHHLFPRIPRHKLPAAKAEILKICARHSLEYKTVSFIEANRLLLRTLRTVAISARKAGVRDTRMLQLVTDALNLAG